MSISQDILGRYEANRMTPLALGVKTLVTLEDHESLSLEGVLLYLIDFVEHYKANKKAEEIREEAGIPYPCAALSTVDIEQQSHIAQSEIDVLVAKAWTRVGDHQVITGVNGKEKLKFASAIANEFIDKATSAKAYSLNKLLIDLRMSFSKKQIDTKLKALNKSDVLLIHDWQLADKSLEDISLLSLFLKQRKKPMLMVMNMLAERWRDDVQQSKLPTAIQKLLLSKTRFWRFKELSESTMH
ncbi:MAG: ATP-binding protein [Marinomonas sp.]